MCMIVIKVVKYYFILIFLTNKIMSVSIDLLIHQIQRLTQLIRELNW